MIVTQTPLRISFFGGGTDFRQFFLEEEGCVLSSAINRYIFVIVKERFDDKIRIGYTQTEMVDDLSEVRHDLVRECLRKTGITKRIEVCTMGDIPSAGSGMGSSSTVTVGLLNAMYHYIGAPKDMRALAEEACEIEIEILGKPIGVQDQYIASFGGQRFLRFRRDGQVEVEPIGLSDQEIRRLNQSLMLFYTNITRKSESVLTEQVQEMNGHRCQLLELKLLAQEARECIRCKEFDHLGLLLDRSWHIKKQLASNVSNGVIDEIYRAAKTAGALGGKIAGAGGGGFLMLYCPLHFQDNVRQALNGLREFPFNLERDGTKVIFNYRR